MSFRTPNRNNNRALFSQPSTTPQIPPPTYLSNPSTTPAGPPPTSLFGSSQKPTSKLSFGLNRSPGKGFQPPESSPPRVHDGDEDDYEDDEDASGEDEVLDFLGESTNKSGFLGSLMSSPRGLKRSRNGKVREPRDSELVAIANGFARQRQPTPLKESDDIVLRHENILTNLDNGIQRHPRECDALLTDAAAQLTDLWSHSASTTEEGSIGPSSSDGLVKATYIASLLLQLHHPHAILPAHSRKHRISSALTERSQACPLPRALLGWLNTYHNPFPDDYDLIHLHRPSPADHERFWDAVYASLSRGKFDRAIRLLSDAGWQNAATAIEDYPSMQPQGYSGKQLHNVEEVVTRCIHVLETCPALTDDDWDVKDIDWRLFRQRVRQAAKNLEMFAGEDDDDLDQSNVFQRSAQINASGNFSLSAASRRAESKVPWSVYENLKLVYGLLLGGVDELLDTSQDWLEASIFLTIWWDGEEDDAPAMRKSVNAGQQQQKPREVDVSPLNAYRKRLSHAYDIVTSDEEMDTVFQVNTLDPVQVALACSMEDSVDSAIRLLKTWSTPVTVATVEIASLGGWLPQSRPRSAGLLQQGFSSEDLMVLSHGQGHQDGKASDTDRDEVLVEYANLLAQRPKLASSDGRISREGWELAISVLGRLGDGSIAQRKIAELLGIIGLDDEARVHRVLKACLDLELTDQARSIAERYADTLASSSQAYGSALLFYARAHAIEKLKEMLALLTSMCLLQSAAMPVPSTIDPTLSSLLSHERTALVELANVDHDAATLLASHFSGYATVRRFYELRDGSALSSASSLKPLERKREAARALMTITESAADCIRGGLFDRSVESVVPVDGVLILLGETLPLLGQNKRIFTREHVFALLRIVEDFATVPNRIRENAESLLQASVDSFRDATSMSQLLQKTRSDVSRTSGMTGSSYDMLATSILSLSQHDKAKGEVAELPKGWDWRRGLDGVREVVKGPEVLTLVRLALAQEVAKGWTGQLNW